MSQIFAHYNNKSTVETTGNDAKESFLDLSSKAEVFASIEGYKSDYKTQDEQQDLSQSANSSKSRHVRKSLSRAHYQSNGGDGYSSTEEDFHHRQSNSRQSLIHQQFDEEDQQLLLEQDADFLPDDDEDYDSFHEEDEYITQYIPYVNNTYRTVGDFQFDEAMKKLTNIFHKTASVDDELQQSSKQMAGDKGPSTFAQMDASPSKTNKTHYGIKVHNQLADERRREQIALDLPYFERRSNTPGSPEMSSSMQRSVFSMTRKRKDEIDEETFYRQLEEDETIREKLDDAIQALEQQGVSLTDAHYSQIPKPKSVGITESQWETVVQRLLRPSAKKQKKIEQLLREKQAKEEANCTYRPKLCEKSLELASGHKSIFDSARLADERHEREMKVAAERRKVEEKRNQHNIFRPKINKSSQNIIRGVETFEAWEQNKQQKIKSFQENYKMREDEECTFNPTLSERSRKIVARKNFQKSVWDRNYEFEFERIKKLNNLMEQQDTELQKTAPEITERAKRIKRKEKIGDRLHSLAMETLSRKKQKREELYHMYYNDDSSILRESLSMGSSRSYIREVEAGSQFDADSEDFYTDVEGSPVRSEAKAKKYRKKMKTDGANKSGVDSRMESPLVASARDGATTEAASPRYLEERSTRSSARDKLDQLEKPHQQRPAEQHSTNQADNMSTSSSILIENQHPNNSFNSEYPYFDSEIDLSKVQSTLSKYRSFRRNQVMGSSPGVGSGLNAPSSPQLL